MIYLSHAPAPPLDRYVEDLWCLSDAPPHAWERIVPSGTLEIVFNLSYDDIRVYDGTLRLERSRRLSGAVVSGAHRAPFFIDTRVHESVVGVHFRPGGAWPFLGAPPGALADDHVDLEMLWGPTTAELHGRLRDAATPARRFRILEEALLARLAHPSRGHAAVRIAIAQLGEGRAAVAEVAALVELSHRRLIELFTAEVGTTPKSFARLRRFQKAFACVTRHGASAWSELAQECGYFDQSHMIRDFVAFAGGAPGEVLRQTSERVKVNHLALPDPRESSPSDPGESALTVSSVSAATSGPSGVSHRAGHNGATGDP
jgi:AraC-like DNA-binding protein